MNNNILQIQSCFGCLGELMKNNIFFKEHIACSFSCIANYVRDALLSLFRGTLLKSEKLKRRKLFFSSLFVCICFCPSAFGTSQCEDIFSDALSRVVQIREKQETQSNYTSDDIARDVNAVSHRLKQEYESNPDQFLSLVRKNLNPEVIGNELFITLQALKFMEDIPLEVVHLIIELIEKNPINSAAIKIHSYRVLMSAVIKDESVFQWLSSRMGKLNDRGRLVDQYEASLIRKVLMKTLIEK